MDGLGMKRVIRIVIRPSFTADQWGLGGVPDREEAATALNAALKTAVNAGDASPPSIFDAMDTALAGYENIDDDAARELVARVVRTVYGVD